MAAIGLVGAVSDKAGKPLSGVMVAVTSASAPALVTKAFSDAQGKYRVPDLGPGVQVNSFDDKSGDLWIANSPIPSNEPDMRRVFMVHPGDR